MYRSKLSVSIVIPVYNEADQLPACLEAIARQTVQPLEVLVVDNNSTDDSVQIAQKYGFVTVLHEPRQGVVYARDTGFNAARGEVIGRIDADTVLAADWVASVQSVFAKDQKLAAVTGRVRYHGLGLRHVLDAIDFRIRRRMARLLGREVAMQGANMAVRRSAWAIVRSHLCRERGLHEDYDLAIHLAAADQRVTFNEKLIATIGFRQAENTWRDFIVYAWLSPKTYALHGLKSRRHMYPIVALVIIAYPLLKLLHRGYDTETERFVWRQLFAEPAQPRVNPALFVD